MSTYTLQDILDSDHYEYITLKHSPNYKLLLNAIELVKSFIKQKELIVYGGTSIDYALRLKGTNIYSDESLVLPDLDFYSYDNVNHAYELANILYESGLHDVRVVSAAHVGTMKVDATNYNDWIADISYCPKHIFDSLPTLDYGGMKIINPTFQRVDMHSALMYPYSNPPTETIFQRWNKDITRFNIVDKCYPINISTQIMMQKQELLLKDIPDDVFIGGMIAYRILSESAQVSGNSINSWKLHYNDMPNKKGKQILEFYTNKIEQVKSLIMEQQDVTEIVHYHKYIGMFPKSIHLTTAKYYIVLYDESNLLPAYINVNLGEHKFKISCMQGLLKHFIGHALLINSSSLKLYETHYAIQHYTALLDYVKANKKNSQLSIEVFGTENISSTISIELSKITQRETKTNDYEDLPVNYYPKRTRENKRSIPVYEYESKYYQLGGEPYQTIIDELDIVADDQ